MSKRLQGAEKRGISAPRTLFAAAEVAAKRKGYNSLSEYLRALIRRDLEQDAKMGCPASRRDVWQEAGQ